MSKATDKKKVSHVILFFVCFGFRKKTMFYNYVVNIFHERKKKKKKKEFLNQ